MGEGKQDSESVSKMLLCEAHLPVRDISAFCLLITEKLEALIKHMLNKNLSLPTFVVVVWNFFFSLVLLYQLFCILLFLFFMQAVCQWHV